MKLEKVTVTRADGQGQVGHFRSPSADTYLQLNVNVELNRTYTLHGYIKSAGNGTLSCLGKSVGTTASWNHFSMQIVPDSKIFSLVFSPGEYWFYNFKLEKGTIMTQWTPNGEDLVVVKQNIVSMGSSINQLNDKITQKVWMTEVNAAKGEVNAHLTNVEQTANKIDWLVKSGTDASNMTLTDNAYSLIAKNIDLTGKVTFNSFGLELQKEYSEVKTNASNGNTANTNLNNYVFTKNTTTINGGNITTGTITADKIATDAIKSKNYMANTSGSYLNLADGSFDSKYLKWDNQGKLTTTFGNIGGWDIGINGIYNDSLLTGFINAGRFRIYAGKYTYAQAITASLSSDNYPNFGVTEDGMTVTQQLVVMRDGASVTGGIATDSLSVNSVLMTDFVVEEDRDDVWIWRKWNSGKIELWSNYQTTATFPSSSLYGYAYYANGTLDLPFTLKTIISTNGNVFCTQSGLYSISFNSRSTSLLGFFVTSQKAEGLKSITLNIYVTGTWK